MKFVLILMFLTSCSGLKRFELDKPELRNQYEAFGQNFMISTQGIETSKAAKKILDLGGNIYDAAVAASFVISVERPHSTGLGGGGFMLIHNSKLNKQEAYDFREIAPRASNKRMFLSKDGKQIRDKSITGALASGTPGLVAGILEIHKKYGKLPLSLVMKPSIDLARNGFKIYPALSEAIDSERRRLCKFKSSREIFLNSNCKSKKTGEILYQKDLAYTLETISKKGKSGFYEGEIAQLIVNSQNANNGLISLKDLKYYKVKNRKPLVGSYNDFKIVSMPPPSSGGTHIIQILNILENYDLKSLGPQSASAIHLTSSAMQVAFADRAEYLGDTDFKSVPIDTLISKKYARKIKKLIPTKKALSSKALPVPFHKLPKESDHTTHFTIMDAKGNTISSTQTINGWFGSALVAKGTGIVMNNEMDDFASHVGGVNLFGAIGGRNNLVEPRKRPLSSMSPTIVFDKKNKPVLALGTPSGTRILTCVMQTILNFIEYDMSLWDSVSATRYHHQWNPEKIRIGSPGFGEDVEAELINMGHQIEKKSLGCKIQAINMKPDGTLHGVSDPREEGMSLGL